MHPSTESKNRGINSNSDKCVKTGNKKKRINDAESRCKNRAKTPEEDNIASLLARESQPQKKKKSKNKNEKHRQQRTPTGYNAAENREWVLPY